MEGRPTGATTRDHGHGRDETRALKTVHVDDLDFPHARQAIKITRWRQDTTTSKISHETVYAITDLTSADARPETLTGLAREPGRPRTEVTTSGTSPSPRTPPPPTPDTAPSTSPPSAAP